MTAKQYTEAVAKLKLNTYAAGPILGVSHRQSFRYAAGDTPVGETVARLLTMLVNHGIPKDWTK